MIAAFFGVIALGTLLLSLPAATVGEPLSLLDAFFTSTSAVCVTGLIVVDTATAFTTFGQIVILALIQIGGIGIISFSAVVILLLGRRVGLVQREVLTTQKVGIDLNIDLIQMGKRILAFVVLIEFAGTVLLAGAFMRYYPWDLALYHAAFHSISAFCNAGFSTFSDSLTAFAGDPVVQLPIMALIVLGGIGFVVVIDFERLLGRRHRLSLHTSIVLWATAVLLVAGAAFFLLLEWNNTLAGMDFGDKLLASAFHSVTCRTAGFNTIDYSGVSNASLVITMILMLVGGSPGSAAGGIKTTTAAIIALTAWASLRGQSQTLLGKRAVAARSVGDATTLTAITVLFVLVVSLGLQFTELGPTSHLLHRGSFLELSFETASAFGTVGLSMGSTPGLSAAGKLLIIATMFVGRLGPLSFFTLISAYRRTPRYRLYSEAIMVG